MLIPVGTARAAVQVITLVNQANASPSSLSRVERAITDQSKQLSRYWDTPAVRFGPAGWRVYLKVNAPDMENLAAFHSENGPTPYAIVLTRGFGSQWWSSDLAHEIDEMLVDPLEQTYANNGTIGGFDWSASAPDLLVEICDPVEGDDYTLDGVDVPDFTLPANWTGGAPPYDYLHKLHRPLTTYN